MSYTDFEEEIVLGAEAIIWHTVRAASYLDDEPGEDSPLPELDRDVRAADMALRR
jgi:hypothetical protein